MQPARSWYLSDLARHLRVPKTSLQRELSNLEGAGIVRRRVEGRHVYFQADPDCPFLPELRGLMSKTAGLVDVIRAALSPLKSRIAFAFVYGSVGRGEEEPGSNVDLMVVGRVGLTDLALPIRKTRERLAREVHPTVFSSAEFAAKARNGEGFVHSVLDKPKLFVVGTEHDLEGPLGPEARDPREGHPPGGRGSQGARGAGPRRRHA
jgi:DNA-binding transcriptional ArsR family regulator